MAIIFLKPVFQERIWGGDALQNWFPDAELGDHIGEAWAISAHPNGSSIVESGEYKDISLDVLYQQQPELFGYPQDEKFPLLVKILDAQTDLSVQVHPDDAYAQEKAGERGKTECWYVLEADPKAKIVLGHTAKTEKEFMQQVKKQKWSKLLVEEAIKPDDFFYIPSGTIHALGAGALILEVQQSSDTTYRLYDYDRSDDKGEKRELHIEQALEVSSIPHQPQQVTREVFESGANSITTLIDNNFFTVKKLSVKEEFDYKRVAHYVLVNVIDGVGTVNGEPIMKGSSFIIPSTESDVIFDGMFDAIISYVNA